LIGSEGLFCQIAPQRKVAVANATQRRMQVSRQHICQHVQILVIESRKKAMNRLTTLDKEMEENALHDINFCNIPKSIVKGEVPITTPPLLVLNGPQVFDVWVPRSSRRPGRSVA